MDDYSDIESDPEPSSEVFEDRNVIKKSRQSLGLSRSYVPDWHARDAFREYFQNWMDGMIESHKVGRNKIKIKIKDSTRFVEISNFKAQLPRKALDMGVTTKANSAMLAGTHGEGFKVASLVMIRKGLQVRYESGKFYWIFSFGGKDRRHLYCNLSPMRESVVANAIAADKDRLDKGLPRQAQSHIWEDVSVKIGNVYGSKTNKGKKIDFDQFMTWIMVALPLQQPTSIIKTKAGDLILDPEFAGRIYLKGIYVGSSACEGSVKYAYNFYDGEINRDRKKLANPTEEAKAIARLWREAIVQDPLGTETKYAELLKDTAFQDFADISSIDKFINSATMGLVWNQIQELDKSKNGFYFNPGSVNAAKDVVKIRKKLRIHPIPLPERTWKALQNFGFVRTPQEHCRHLLLHAPVIDDATTQHGVETKRLLNMGMSLNSRSSGYTFTFKQSSIDGLDLLLQDKELLVDAKYLDFKTAHMSLPCHLSDEGIKSNTNPCDHVIEHLYSCAVGAVLGRGTAEGDITVKESNNKQGREFRKCLKQMPRAVQLHEGEKAGELTVTWTDTESAMMFFFYGIQLNCRVTLHCESTCAGRRTDQLSGMILESISSRNKQLAPAKLPQKNPEVCNCQYQIVSQKDGIAKFRGLNIEEKYFAMVARDHKRAFFACPPPSKSPKGDFAEAHPKEEAEPDPVKAKVEVGQMIPLDPLTERSQQLNDMVETLRLKDEAHVATTQQLNMVKERLKAVAELHEGQAIKLRQSQTEKGPCRRSIQAQKVMEELDIATKAEKALRTELGAKDGQLLDLIQRNDELLFRTLSMNSSTLQAPPEAPQIQKLGNTKIKLEKDTENSHTPSSQTKQQPTLQSPAIISNTRNPTVKIEHVQDEIKVLKAKIRAAEGEKISLIQSLQGLLQMVQVALTLPNTAMMISAIKPSLSLMEHALRDVDSRMQPGVSVQTVERNKRSREEGGDGWSGGEAKRVKQGVIDIDSD